MPSSPWRHRPDEGSRRERAAVAFLIEKESAQHWTVRQWGFMLLWLNIEWKEETSPLLYQLRRIYSTGCLQPWSPALGNLQMTGVFHPPTKLIWLLIFQAGNLGYSCKYLSGMVRRIMSPRLGIWKFGSCTSQISMCGKSLETMLIIARGLFNGLQGKCTLYLS